MHDFDDIVLIHSEKSDLKKFLFHKRIPEEAIPDSVHVLASYGLIKRNYSDETNEYGEHLSDGTYSLTDLYFRYRAYKRQQFRKSFVYPIVIAFITSVITTLTTLLLSRLL